MKDTLISYETACLAKEKGFNERLKHSYYSLEEGHRLNGDYYARVYHSPYGYSTNQEDTARVSAPSQSLLQKWLRDVHQIHVEPKVDVVIDPSKYAYWLKDLRNPDIKGDLPSYIFNSYEEALEHGLKKGLNLIEC